MPSLRGKQNGGWLVLLGVVMLAASLSFTSGGAAFEDPPAAPSVQV